MNTTNTEVAVRAMRAGFTLMEIIVAVAIIGILSTLAVVNITRQMENAKKTAARSGVMNVKEAVTGYYIEFKRYPNDLNVLVESSGDHGPIIEGGPGALEDPWGTNYKMEGRGSKIAIVSAGPDMEFGTEDDIRSDTVRSSNKN